MRCLFCPIPTHPSLEQSNLVGIIQLDRNQRTKSEPNAKSLKDRANHFSVHVRQTTVGAVVAERQLGVFQSQQIEDGGVKIVSRDRLDGFPRPFVAFAEK